MVKLIIDTDIGPDCDDAGAIAIANLLHKRGDIQLLGVTHCRSDISGAYTIAAINSYYHNGDTLVGQTSRKGFLCGDECKIFTEKIAEKYIKDCGRHDFSDSIKLTRMLLSENKGVKLVYIGQMSELASLLKSEPDESSPFCGTDLVAESVESVVVMGGDFRKEDRIAEYNIRCDIASARFAADNCPVPVIYCGYETGMDVITGMALKNAEPGNPVKTAYEGFLSHYGRGGSYERPSWDLIAVCCAVMGETELWKYSKAVSVSFDENGMAVIKSGGKDRYLINNASPQKIAEMLEEFLAQEM